MRRARKFVLLAAVLALAVGSVHADEVLVSVQTKTSAEMEALTAAVDGAAQGEPIADAHTTNRVTLGAIEATMSKVVDVDAPYLKTVPEAVPMLSLLQNVAFDPDQRTWTLEYESMETLDAAALNRYYRALYFSKATALGGAGTTPGDLDNACLERDVTDAACAAEINSKYYPVGGDVLLTDGAFTGDCVDHDGTGTCDQCAISVTKTAQANSDRQTLVVVIPHYLVREKLATAEVVEHPVYGSRTQYVFGVGMVFVSAGSNVVMFDTFTVIENSYEQIAVSQVNEYSVAKHVAFWTIEAATNPAARVVSVEYLLRPGFVLDKLEASINGQTVTPEQCAAMQALVDALPSNCLTQWPLCHASMFTSGEGADAQVWATYVLPLPAGASAFAVNTLLTTREAATNETVLSTLNFETAQAPQQACAESTALNFDATQFVALELLRGSGLVAETLQGTFSVFNDTSLSMTESLMTVVVRPKDEASSIDYFTRYTDESLALDELYMSHALYPDVLPASVENAVSAGAHGRSSISLDSALLAACPMETAYQYQQMETAPASHPCVTTADWSLSGELARPASSTPLAADSCAHCRYFVREVAVGEAAGPEATRDLEWLQSNVFGGAGAAQAQAFRDAAIARVPAAVRQWAKVYWVLPLYAWPGHAPMGLRDRVLVSLSWSLTKPPAATGRRLLQAGTTLERYEALAEGDAGKRRPELHLHAMRKRALYKRATAPALPAGWSAAMLQRGEAELARRAAAKRVHARSTRRVERTEA